MATQRGLKATGMAPGGEPLVRPTPTVTRSEAQPPFALALDIGTSSSRVLLYDRELRAVEGVRDQQPYAPRTTTDGGAELNVKELLDVTIGLLDTALRSAGSLAADIAVVGVSCFWHSLVGLRADGEPLTPVYLWADTRAGHDAYRLERVVDGSRLHARTGAVLHSSYWPAKLTWLARTQSSTFALVRSWVSFAEYLTLRLFGTLRVSVSMASGTGLLDVHACAWDGDLLDTLGIRADQLSPISDEPLRGLTPEFALRWPTLSSTLWFPAWGDGACSNVGVGATDQQRAALTIGTSSALRVVVPRDDVTIPRGLWAYRVDKRRFILGGALSEGGNLIAWVSDTFRLPPLEEAERRIAARAPDAGRITVLPYIAGERSPHWSPYACAALVGFGLHTTPEDILQACLESVAYQLDSIYTRLSDAVSEPDMLIATGGALLRSPVWIQIIADVLGRPLQASLVAESSSRGAAALACEAAGLLSIPAVAPLGERYEANSDKRIVYGSAAMRQTELYINLVGD